MLHIYVWKLDKSVGCVNLQDMVKLLKVYTVPQYLLFNLMNLIERIISKLIKVRLSTKDTKYVVEKCIIII